MTTRTSSSSSSKESKKDSCPTCKQNVSSNQKALECEVCEEWFHTNCQKVSDDVYAAIEKDESVHWYCHTCNKGMRKILESLQKILMRQDKLEAEMTNFKKQVQEDFKSVNEMVEMQVAEVKRDLQEIKNKSKEELSQAVKDIQVIRKESVELKKTTTNELSGAKRELDDVKKTVTELKSMEDMVKATDTKVETLIESKLVEIEKNVDNVVVSKVKDMKETVDEQLEIEKRKNNIVVHGLPDVETMIVLDGSDGKTKDQEVVEELLKSGLKIDATRHIVEVGRIGKYNKDKCRPLRVVLKTHEGKVDVMKRAKDLKDVDEYKKVYITPDLTRKQQLNDKKLREELRKIRGKREEDGGEPEAKIRSGKIVKNLQGGGVQVLYQLNQ